MSQGELPFVRGSATSREAGELAREGASSQRARVLHALTFAADNGATDEELQTALELNPSTERPRRIELVNSGRARDSGRTRPTKSGRQAVVWVAV